MANSILGIDFSSEGFRVVELDQTGKVLGWKSAPIPEDPDEYYQFIHEFFKKNRFRSRLASISLGVSKLNYQLIELPTLQEQEERPALELKIESAGMLMAYSRLPININEDSRWYFVVTVPESVVVNIINAVQKAGIWVKEVVPAAVALQEYLKSESLETDYLVFDCGEKHSLFVLMKDNTPLIARDMKLGLEDLSSAMEGGVAYGGNKIEIGPEKAKELLKQYGIPLNIYEYTKNSSLPAEAVMSLVRPALENITLEILRTIDYCRSLTKDQTAFNQVVLVGEGALIANLKDHLQADLGREVVLSQKNLFEGSQFYVRAIGAALLGKKAAMSLLPDRFRHPWKFLLRWATSWIALVSYFVIGMFLSYAYYSSLNQQMIAKSELLNKELAEKGLSANQPATSGSSVDQFRQTLGIPMDRSEPFASLLDKLSLLTPDEVNFLSLNYDKQAKAANLSGVTLLKDVDRVSEFLRKLQAEALFSKVELVNLQKSDRFSVPAYEFQIKLTMNIGE